MVARVMIGGAWASVSDALSVLNHPGHDQKSHGRSRGGAGSGKDISGSADFESIAEGLPDHEVGRPPRHGVKVGDDALVRIQAEQGFDGAPTVVSRAEFDRAAAAGEVTETFRGISGTDAEAHAEQYRSGELFRSTGVYGNGTYVAMERSQADAFAGRDVAPGKGAVLRIGLRSDAKVVTYTALRAQMKAHTERNADRVARVDELDREMGRKARATETIDEQISVYADYGARKTKAAGPEFLVSQDEGRFAALRGYDAIDIPGGQGGDQMIVLNRTAVIVEEAS